MATYVFLNTKTKKLEEHVMSMMVYDDFKKNNPHLERYIENAPALNATGYKSVDQGTDNTWKEVLSKIGEQNPHSPLAEKYGPRKTTKKIKTLEVINKHAKKQRELAADRAKRK